MRYLTAAIVFCLSCANLPARAGDAVYKFRGLVEYGAAPGTLPPYPPEQAMLALITVTLDKKAVASVTANTATYRGGSACGPNPDPVVSLTVQFGTVVDPYARPGVCDSVVIQQNVNGVSSIAITTMSFEVGTLFNASFTGTSANAVTSLAIPDKIDTAAFDRSTFMAVDGGGYVFSGDMASRVAPPPSQAAAGR